MKRKTCFIVTLALCLLLLFSAAALADAPTELTVNGVDLLAEGAVAPQGVAYDPATNTLTLTNAKLTQGRLNASTDYEAEFFDCIFANGDLNVTLVGDNTIDLSQAGNKNTYGLTAEESLTIGGSGSLTIIGCHMGLTGFENLIINGGVFLVKDARTAYRGEESLTLNNGQLTAEGCAFGLGGTNMVINGGSVKVSGGEEALRACRLTVNGGLLDLAGSKAALTLAFYNSEEGEPAADNISLNLGPQAKMIKGGQLYRAPEVYSYLENEGIVDEEGQPSSATRYFILAAVAPAEPQFVIDDEYEYLFTITGAAKEVKIVSSEFSDVLAKDYFFDGVGYVTAAGLMNGVGGGLFAPEGQMTRGMLVTVLWRMAGSPEGYADKATAKSADSPSGASYDQNAVGWAYDTGVITGYGDGTLRLGQAISREQLAAFLYRYEQAQGGGFAENWMFQLDFADAEAISDYAYEAMAWCVMNGIITGVGNDMLAPGGFATRGQMATMLQRYAAVERPEAAE